MLEHILTKYRGIIVTIFLLPASVVLRIYLKIKHAIVLMLHSAPKKHEIKVKRIQRQLKEWRDSGAQEKLCTNRSPWKSMSELVPSYKKSYRNINIDMHSILAIDLARHVVRVEPMVNMGQLTASLNPRGWTLAIVPELDDLTVGGLIMGFGVESSSHRYGLFQYICESFDIITPDGQLRHCSEQENQDLFYSIPWSHGTLGFLVAAELRIIPAGKYVELQYEPVHSRTVLLEKFESASRIENDVVFVEALTFSKDEAVLMTGRLVDKPSGTGSVNHIGRWYKPWFYTHVRSFLKRGRGIEYIPLRQYYHRHTRSYFWEMREIIPFGNKAWFRWMLGWAMPPHIQLLKKLQTGTIQQLREKRHVVQDMLIPMTHLENALEYIEDRYQLHPLWLCPMKVYGNPAGQGFIHPFRDKSGQSDDLFVDIGLYGTPLRKGFDGNSELRALEEFVIDHSGYQALYAKTLMTEEQFRQMFDHSHYDRLREKLPFVKQAFNDVYAKVARGRVAPHELKNAVKMDQRDTTDENIREEQLTM